MKPEEFKDLLEKLESLGFEAGREAKDNWRGWQKRRAEVSLASRGMNPAEQRQRWIEDHGIDLWKARAMAQFQGLLPEFARAVSNPPNLRLLRAMERLCYHTSKNRP